MPPCTGIHSGQVALIYSRLFTVRLALIAKLFRIHPDLLVVEDFLHFIARHRTLSFMSIVGHGIDLVECSRIAKVMQNHPDRFVERILTPAEQVRSKEFSDPIPYIAGRWAAKEAILKTIGTGWRGQIAWTDMEILPDTLGQPIVTLTGETARIAKEKGIRKILLSITHTDAQAAASAIGLA